MACYLGMWLAFDHVVDRIHAIPRSACIRSAAGVTCDFGKGLIEKRKDKDRSSDRQPHSDLVELKALGKSRRCSSLCSGTFKNEKMLQINAAATLTYFKPGKVH